MINRRQTNVKDRFFISEVERHQLQVEKQLKFTKFTPQTRIFPSVTISPLKAFHSISLSRNTSELPPERIAPPLPPALVGLNKIRGITMRAC